MFSALGAERLNGACVLDLFAGSGALGIEALSRGAAYSLFVEHDQRALATIDENLASLGIVAGASVWRGSVEQFLRAGLPGSVPASGSPTGSPFSLVFVDPPYDLPDEALVELLSLFETQGGPSRDRCRLRSDATIVIERPARARPTELCTLPAGWRCVWERTFGDTLVLFAVTSRSPSFPVS